MRTFKGLWRRSENVRLQISRLQVRNRYIAKELLIRGSFMLFFQFIELLFVIFSLVFSTSKIPTVNRQEQGIFLRPKFLLSIHVKNSHCRSASAGNFDRQEQGRKWINDMIYYYAVACAEMFLGGWGECDFLKKKLKIFSTPS